MDIKDSEELPEVQGDEQVVRRSVKQVVKRSEIPAIGCRIEGRKDLGAQRTGFLPL